MRLVAAWVGGIGTPEGAHSSLNFYSALTQGKHCKYGVAKMDLRAVAHAGISMWYRLDSQRAMPSPSSGALY